MTEIYVSHSAVRAGQDHLASLGRKMANINNPNYRGEEVNYSLPGSVSGGVRVDITQEVNSVLERERFLKQGNASAAEVIKTTLESLQPYYGHFGGEDTSLSSLTTFFNKVSDFANKPLYGAADSIKSLKDFLKDSNAFKEKCQSLRADQEVKISESCREINALLKQYNECDKALSFEKNGGRNGFDQLNNKREILIKLSKFLPVAEFEQGNGGNTLCLINGMPLVSSGRINNLSFTPVVSMSANSVTNSINIGGVPIDNALKIGELKERFELRDTTLPLLYEQHDRWASQLTDVLNSVHNKGTAYPPPTQLRGTRSGLNDATAFQGQNTVRVALVDNRNPDSHPITAYADINLGAVATVGNLRTALNGINDGVNGVTINAAYTPSGELTLTSSNAQFGIAITSLQEGPHEAIEIGTGRNFSHFFGFNDLVIKPSPLGDAFDVRSSINSLTFARGRLSTVNAPILGTTEAVEMGDTKNLLELSDIYNKSYDFNGIPGFDRVSTTFKNFSARMVQYSANLTEEAKKVEEKRSLQLKTIEDAIEKLKGSNFQEIVQDIVGVSLYIQGNSFVIQTHQRLLKEMIEKF